MDDRNANSRIGCICWGTNKNSVEAVPDFAEAGIRWIRASRPMQLETVSDVPGVYDWKRAGEESIDLAVANGISIMGILDGRWGNETFVNKLPWCSPVWVHLDIWCDFVAATVEHYKDRVRCWEVINEPPFFWWYPPAAEESFDKVNGKMKRAPVRRYAELLKATAKTIRACDPGAKIVAGSTFSDADLLRRLYELGCRDYFDIASIHYLPCHHPEAFAKAYRNVRNVMARYGDENKPLWDTESGPGGATIGCAVESKLEYQAYYNVYRHCLAHEFNLERYFWFNPVHNPRGYAAGEGIPAPSQITVKDLDGVFSTPYRALQVLESRIGTGGLTGCFHVENEVHIYVFEGTDGPVSIAWSTAPATLWIPPGIKAFDPLGQPFQPPPGHLNLTGKPLYFETDLLLADVTAKVNGPREAVIPCWPDKLPKPETPIVKCHKISKPLSLSGAGWDDLPLLASRDEITAGPSIDHFCAVPSGLPAEIHLGYDNNALYIQCRLWDDRLDEKHPSGLVQFTIRDSNPEVMEWPHFLNGYALFNLHVSEHGARFLCYEHLLIDEYPSGVVEDIPMEAIAGRDNLLVRAVVPWKAIGPCKPGNNNPFFCAFTTSRCDELLDVPPGDDPAEWPQNFMDSYIVRAPSLQRWIVFG